MYISAYHHLRSQLKESNKELVIDNSIETPVLTGPGRIRTYDLAFTSGQYGVLLPLHPRCQGRNCDFELKNGSGFCL